MNMLSSSGQLYAIWRHRSAFLEEIMGDHGQVLRMKPIQPEISSALFPFGLGAMGAQGARGATFPSQCFARLI